MIIKDIALWELENSEILSRSKHNNVLQQYKTQNHIILLWYADPNFEKCIKLIKQENENLEVKS